MRLICALRGESGSSSASCAFQYPTEPTSSSSLPRLGYGCCATSPERPTRTSELLLPPNTGRSCTRATRQPRRAALTAAQQPAMPPPTTTRSYGPTLFARRPTGVSRCRNRAMASDDEGGAERVSEVIYMASQRPSKPVRSCSRSSFPPRCRVTVPPSCQCHSSPSVPKRVDRGCPFTATLKRPGEPWWLHRAAQSRVRTQMR